MRPKAQHSAGRRKEKWKEAQLRHNGSYGSKERFSAGGEPAVLLGAAMHSTVQFRPCRSPHSPHGPCWTVQPHTAALQPNDPLPLSAGGAPRRRSDSDSAKAMGFSSVQSRQLTAAAAERTSHLRSALSSPTCSIRAALAVHRRSAALQQPHVGYPALQSRTFPAPTPLNGAEGFNFVLKVYWIISTQNHYSSLWDVLFVLLSFFFFLFSFSRECR